jgi:outer membrane protein TolC
MNTTIHRLRGRSAAPLLSLLSAWLILTPLNAVAEPASLGAILDPPRSDRDQQTYQTLQKIFEQEDRVGDWNPMQKRSLVYLSSGDILLRALQHNLPLRMSERDAEKVKQAVQEAQAVFYPVFRVGVNRSETFTYERAQSGTVFLRKSLPTTNGQPYLDVNTAPFNANNPQINRIGFIQQNPVNPTVQKGYLVHKKKEPGSYTTWTGTMSVEQQLPWGQQLSLSKVTTHEETYYDANRKKSWGMPWAVTVKANILTPLFGKNFGVWSPQNTDVKQSKLQAKKVDWNLKATINDILAEASLVYWDLVQKVENLKVAIQNQRELESQVAHAERMLAAGRITKYGYTQIATELARARVTVVQDKESLIATSTNLAAIIEEDDKVVADSLILPVEYSNLLESQAGVDDWQGAVETALENRPELKSRALDVESSANEQKFRRNQTRPDILVSASHSLKQDNSTYGYESYLSSLSSSFNPDSKSTRVGVTYTYPLRNRAAKAALARANLVVDGSQLSADMQHQVVRKEVSDALTTLSSARARIASVANYEDLAAKALEKGKKRWQVKADIRSTELVIKSRNLLDARLARVAATVAYKQAETNLLAAQGLLAQKVAEQSAVNDFDRHRLLVLSSSGATPYFSNSKQPEDGEASTVE